MMMTLVMTFATIGFGKLNAIAFDLIDGADVNAVGSDYFHMFFDVGHLRSFLSEA